MHIINNPYVYFLSCTLHYTPCDKVKAAILAALVSKKAYRASKTFEKASNHFGTAPITPFSQGTFRQILLLLSKTQQISIGKVKFRKVMFRELDDLRSDLIYDYR